MSVTIPLQSIALTPSSCISIDSLSGQDYENFLAERGKSRSRVTYYPGTLEIVSPLPLHERPHRIIAVIVTKIFKSVTYFCRVSIFPSIRVRIVSRG
jgi:Uma2 family endonuclease